MKTVLIVEDDRNIALALAVRLRAAGFETLTARDAESGVDMAVEHAPDLLLLDISMPGGGGFAVAENLRARAETAAMPLVFMTAARDTELMRRAAELGAAAFLEKPYEEADLLCKVRSALGEETQR